MMDHSLKLEKPSLSKAWFAAVVMALAYFIGGILPMLPYFFYERVLDGLYTSVGVTVFLLITFGYVKAHVTGCGHREAMWSAGQTLLVGALASGASFGVTWGLNHGLHDGHSI
jgi:vacuolar iron transporter family protein